uniref:SecA family profile domain-containing protein n=1 Tax=Cryptomonas curvata TaxID=233186 RepID=A0A7S0M5L2_9CRYP
MLGIDIKCGDFSYAALPTRYYSMIFGVTGTLNTLSSDEKSLLQTEYNITKETVVPSAYGSKRGRLDFTFENQLHVMVLENEAEWHARIDKEISEAVAVGRPVLVCFKNDKALQHFISSRPRFGTAKRLDANLDDSDVDYINGIVANATLPGKVTLLTRKFGRGLDFKPNKESNAVGGVLVIQTFFSSAESEQIQIMGRTARQGEKGSYRLIMSSEHLKDKFGFEYSDDAASLSLKSALDSVRAQTMKEKFDSRSKKKLEADAADRKSWAFAKELYGSGSAADKLVLLNSLQSSAKSMTFILMLDVSGSMGPHYPTLLAAFNTFVATLINHGHGADTLLTVIFFDNDTWTHVVNKPVPDIHQLPANMPGGGGTSFSKAFARCTKEIQIAQSRDASRAFTLIFLTDGEDPSFKTSQIDQLTRKVGTHVEEYISIAFGPNVSAKLVEVKQAFEHAGIRTRSIAPSNAQELVEAFATAACDSGLHMR